MSNSTPLYLDVEIADACQQIFSGPCYSVVAPAALGEVCILPRHAPFLSRLVPGEIRLETDLGETLRFYVSGGYLETQHASVTVLADRMLRTEEIDREAALEAKRQAELTLKKSHLFTERDKAKLDLVKALAQLRLLEQVNITKLQKRHR